MDAEYVQFAFQLEYMTENDHLISAQLIGNDIISVTGSVFEQGGDTFFSIIFVSKCSVYDLIKCETTVGDQIMSCQITLCGMDSGLDRGRVSWHEITQLCRVSRCKTVQFQDCGCKLIVHPECSVQ